MTSTLNFSFTMEFNTCICLIPTYGCGIFNLTLCKNILFKYLNKKVGGLKPNNVVSSLNGIPLTFIIYLKKKKVI